MSKYSLRKIAAELLSTAQGEAYHGNSLRVAKDIPGISSIERSTLDAWLTGRVDNNPFHYRMLLQDIAIKILRIAFLNESRN